MTSTDILTLRLHNEQVTQKSFSTPAEIVKWFGAVQSQDYANAKWAIGQRVTKSSDEEVEMALTNGEILRTHVMRPTWHFIHPEDIHWMQMLTSSRVMTVLNHYNKQLGLDEKTFEKTNEILREILKGKNALTREEIGEELKKQSLDAKGMRLAHIVIKAELDAVICSGPRKGKQSTYMLVSERAPKAKKYSMDEALAELVRRYFMSHGPATVRDFSWWSGLTMAETRKGIEMSTTLEKELINNTDYYFFPTSVTPLTNEVFLLPNYDEYTIAFKERSDFFNPEDSIHLDSRGNSIFQHTIIYRGKIIGMWKRTVKTNSILITSQFFTKPTEEVYESYKKTAESYGKFFGLRVEIT